ncbi:MAG: TonB-dependent receptor, partial [Candidatus Omnitrophica bacterium]|nr:TonB-dependent receptor [Candidatus Omnitrophota bacterium]
HSEASLYQPDKRQFGSLWWAESNNPGFPPFVPPSVDPEVHRPYKPAANFTLGNLQRIWKDISEESDQYAWNLKLPFEQWSGDEGYFKFGVFKDLVTREYNQDSFSNFNDNSARYEGPFEDLWSTYFPSENHPVTAADIDVDYTGETEINAWYYMVDLPLTSQFKLIGGARFEDTRISIINDPESDVTWIPPGSSGGVVLNPGDADVSYEQSDVLPSIGFVYDPFEKLTIRGSYTQTVARQTFKELTPIQQQEFLGGDVFIGNPFLQMSALKNYDIRLDYTPVEGS